MNVVRRAAWFRKKNILFSLSFLFFSFLLFECIQKPLEPILPKYKTTLAVPLIDRTYSLFDLASKDTSRWTAGPSGGWIYQPSSLQNAPSYISLPPLDPVTGKVVDSVGPIPLDIPPAPGTKVSFQDIFGVSPPSGPFPGSDMSATVQDSISNAAALYDFIVFQSGRMTLTITNNFPFGISISNPGVEVSNLDFGGGIVGTFAFSGTIQAGQSVTSSSDISGKLMSKNLQMHFTFQTVGIQGDTITGTDNLIAGFSIDGGSSGTEATLDSAQVELTEDRTVQSVQDSSAQLDDSTQIKEADFSDGKFEIYIENDVDADVVVAFKLKEFRNIQTGQAFSLEQNGSAADSIVISARGTGHNVFTQIVDLKDYKFLSQNISGGDTIPTNSMHFSLTILTVKTTGTRPVISKNDSVFAEIIPLQNNQSPPTTQYILQRVEGRVRPTPVSISDGVSMYFGDANNKFTADQINFDSVTIAMNVLCSGLFPTDFQLKVIPFRKGKPGQAMDAHDANGNSTLHIDPGQVTQIVFSKSNSSIDQFLGSFITGGNGNLPDSIAVQGNAVINPLSSYSDPVKGIGGVQNGDSIVTSLNFSFPLRIAIQNGVFLDTFALPNININKSNLTDIDTGTISYAVQNEFPFQLGVTSTLLSGQPDNPSVADSVLLHLPATDTIQVDSSHYFTTGQPGNSFTLMSLGPSDVAEFNPAQFVVVRIAIKTSGNNGTPVILNRTDQIHIKAFANIIFNVDFDKNNNQ
jgi:hypothetical protein